jgi:hypothetical protein
MSVMNPLTRNEAPALQEVETSELQAIVGGQDGGHGHSEQSRFPLVPGDPTPWLPHPQLATSLSLG